MIPFKKPKKEFDIEIIYTKYKKLMYKEIFYILKDAALTEDAIHDSILKLLNISDIPEFESEAQERAYVLTVCKNTALSTLRKLNRFAKEDISEFEEVIPDETCSPDEIIITKETNKIIVDTIKEMDDKYQSVFILRKVHNFSFEEIGDLHGISYENAKKRYSRAKAQILNAIVKGEKQ